MPAMAAKKRTTKRRSTKKKAQASKRMSDVAVKNATGKSWDQWLALLDKAGAKSKNHREIVATLSSKHKLSPWWEQMITVTYERERGLRKVHERVDGFSISRSKTIATTIEDLYRAWSDAKVRQRWLEADDLSIRSTAANRSMRLNWPNGQNVEIMFYEKGSAKAQVTVQHNRLPSAKAGEQMKKFWGAQLVRLVTHLAS
jgi:hypothetical protein